MEPGTKGMAGTDSIHTLLMTDVVGSTRLWAAHPRVMPDAIERLEALAEKAVANEGGDVVKRRGEGDSLFCVMPEPAAAARAAAALVRGLRGERWPEGVALEIRAAIHCGSARERGGDLFGPMPNRCARLREVGHGGQILLSGAARTQLPTEIAVLDLGRHRLRDLDEPETVYQLVGEGLPAEFPALRSLSCLRNNLPLQLTRFVGRVALREALAEGLAAHRLTTLTGAGGSGKTRLALQVAAEAIDRYPDGVWSVDLADVLTPEGVVRAIAEAWGVRDLPESGDVALLTDRYRDRDRCLLVLDNAEQALGPIGGAARALLAGLPGLTLLTTTREPLRIPGERVVRVPPLSVPPAGTDDLEAVAASEAGGLFLDRATLHLPEFALARSNAAAVTAILRRVDGIPLCLEMAASHVGYLSAQEIAARLDDRFALLEDDDPNAPARHRTMRETIAWQYDTLAPDERRLLQRLAAFVGGFPMEGAEAVAQGGVGGRPALRLLRALVEKSLVVAYPEGADTRYRLLETIGQFAEEQPEGETEAALPALLGWSERVASAGYAGMGGAEGEVWSHRLDLEGASIRRALDWAVARRDGRACRLVLDLTRYWFFRGRYLEARRALEAAFPMASPGPERAEVGSVLGVFRNRLGDAAGSESAYRAALAEAGLPDTLRLRLLNNLAITLSDSARYDEALGVSEEATRLAEGLGEDRTSHLLRVNHAQILIGLRRWSEAADAYASLGEVFRRRSDANNASNCELWLAYCLLRLDDSAKAARSLLRAVAEAGTDPRAEFLVDVWLVGAAVVLARGHPEVAAFLLGGHERKHEELGATYTHRDRNLWQEVSEGFGRATGAARRREEGRASSYAGLLEAMRDVLA